MGQDDVLEFLVADFLEIAFPRQVTAQTAVHVLNGTFLPGRVGIAEPGGNIERIVE